MPLGIGFMGTQRFEDYLSFLQKKSQMPLGIGFMGNYAFAQREGQLPQVSQMPLGIGFMGNSIDEASKQVRRKQVTNASRHWVHGERGGRRTGQNQSLRESQIPLGIRFMGNFS